MARAKPAPMADSLEDTSFSLGRCAADQAETLPDGWCPRGEGYALTVWDGQSKYPQEVRCPFACPVCRGPLGWEGACRRCHGSASLDPATWVYPGDGYRLTEGRHWRLTDKAPIPLATPAQVAAHVASLRVALARIRQRVTP